ncbi:hypothetical protein K0M31_008354 [Melipona bicolor]|uniref:Uncharacterized protein n=1 Tax=Melipona bicolor TaxID=60889 RepID=A0AA40KKR0_9HYME|nr:hypothetical protein K0M31_008354 [Melipona bicolor]
MRKQCKATRNQRNRTEHEISVVEQTLPNTKRETSVVEQMLPNTKRETSVVEQTLPKHETRDVSRRTNAPKHETRNKNSLPQRIRRTKPSSLTFPWCFGRLHRPPPRCRAAWGSSGVECRPPWRSPPPPPCARPPFPRPQGRPAPRRDCSEVPARSPAPPTPSSAVVAAADPTPVASADDAAAAAGSAAGAAAVAVGTCGRWSPSWPRGWPPRQLHHPHPRRHWRTAGSKTTRPPPRHPSATQRQNIQGRLYQALGRLLSTYSRSLVQRRLFLVSGDLPLEPIREEWLSISGESSPFELFKDFLALLRISRLLENSTAASKCWRLEPVQTLVWYQFLRSPKTYKIIVDLETRQGIFNGSLRLNQNLGCLGESRWNPDSESMKHPIQAPNFRLS